MMTCTVIICLTLLSIRYQIYGGSQYDEQEEETKGQCLEIFRLHLPRIILLFSQANVMQKAWYVNATCLDGHPEKV